MNTIDFINKAAIIHGDKYDYSKSEFKKFNINIKIICSIHGEFEQKPVNHLAGKGCKFCGKLRMKESNSLNDYEFISRAKLVHGDEYDYSKIEYKSAFIDVKIICKIHGEFYQKPRDHIQGNGCQECGKIKANKYNNDIVLDNIKVISKFNDVHKNKYDYSKVDYKNYIDQVVIICPIHGEFEQRPYHHLRGYGCSKCGYGSAVSKPHQEIVDLINCDKIINDRETIKPYELDIFIPGKNIAIEYHGIYYHSYDRLESSKDRFKHHNKASVCFDKGIQLIQIFEDEWLNKKKIVKSIINAKLGINNKIFARKCEIKELTSNEFNEFCINNHIQGKLDTSIRLGLTNSEKIMCVIGFNKHSKYDYECTRFCNELNINVVGGASRLFKYFLNKWKPESILSFADRRYSNGGLYKTLGFGLVGITNPGYFYIKGVNRFSRQSFQKHKLKDKLKIFDNSLSESVNMFNNKYRRIWDAGHWKFVWKIQRQHDD